MADPVLTTLCSICHVSTPIYKCPRCGIRTCSGACIKKHKAWSECSGERDATAYLAPSKLKTPAGVDHDYNFLHGIERAVERNERILVGDKGIIQEEELRPLTLQEVKWKPGRDGRKRKVLVTRVLREAKGRVFERFLAQRLKKLNITIMCAPLGMSRQKENNTTLNRKSGRINWQVEWLSFNGANTASSKVDAKASRSLSKVMDNVPLYEAYHQLLEDQARKSDNAQFKRPIKGHRISEAQTSNSTWNPILDTLQDPLNAAWISTQTADIDIWPSEKDEAQRSGFQFFLSTLRSRSDLPTEIINIEAGECLRNVLTDGKVLEFPTIYVLKSGESIPEGFTIKPKDQASPQGTKRKGGPAPRQKQSRSAKRRRPHGGRGMEEGELAASDADEGNSDDNDNHGGSKGSVGLEAGEVIAEQSLGEEDDDSTSSSGSDSEMD